MQRQRRRGTPITYVRSPDRPDVYSVEQSLRSLTNRSVEDWRDKQIWALDRSQIQRIDFRYPADSSFTLRRAVRSDTSAAPDAWVADGDTLSRSDISSMIETLSAPHADGFAEQKTPEALDEPLYTIRLHLSQQESGSTRTLRLRLDSEGNHYLTTADGYPYVAEVQKARWDRSVLQGRTALLSGE